MRGAYLVFGWPEDYAGAVDQAQAWRVLLADAGWTCRLAQAGLEAWTYGAAPPVTALPPPGGVLVGRLLDLGFRSLAGIDGAEARARRMIRDGWGSYVAVLREGGGEALALRDPSGAVDAVSWRQGAIRAVASDLTDLPAGFQPATIALDWDVIADFLRRPVALAGRSALRGVVSIAPGELRPLGGEGAAMALWRPADFAANAPDAGVDESGLRGVVARAVEGLVRAAGPHLVEISGGFDSSVVLALLHKAGLSGSSAQRVNYVGDRPEGDERAWVAELCDPLGLEVVAARKPMAPFDPEAVRALGRSVRPPVRASDTARDADGAARVRAVDAQAIITGYGGDAVFFQRPTPWVVADYLQAHGRRGVLDPFVPQAARWLRRSVWSLLAEVSRDRKAAVAAPRDRLWGERVWETPVGLAHPWLEGVEDLPPARRLQLAELAGCQLSWLPSARTRAADLVQPLLSQPVLEACLGIPTWRLVQGARDRAMARRAFAGVLPDAIARRTSKGMLTSYYARRAALSLEVLRPLLLEGVLVGAGLLDRDAVEAALSPETLIWRGEAPQLMTAAVLEVWLRDWQTRIPDARDAPRVRPARIF